MKIIVASGYFNPLHKGHVEYLERARTLGDMLIVIVNTDLQRAIKGSKEFMDQYERIMIVNALRCVDQSVLAIDIDGTVCKTLEMLRSNMLSTDHLTFAKGGDRFASEIPEAEVCHRLGIDMVDGLGNKIQSSSWLLRSQ